MLDRKSNNKLKQLQEECEALFKHVKDIIVLFDKKGKILYINPAVKKITGFSIEEMKGKSFKDFTFVNSKNRRKLADYFAKRLKNPEDQSVSEVEGVSKNGRKIIVEVSANPLKSGRKVIAVLVIARDINKRKQIENMLKDSKERLRNMLTSSPEAITVTDLNGFITECNQATLNMHGFSSKEELIGKKAFDLIASKDHKKALANMKKTLKQGFIKDVEYTFLTKDGREFPAELSASVVLDTTGKPIAFMAITRNIFKHKQSLKAGKEFISIASHQLRTPLAIMNWYSEMLLGDNTGRLNNKQGKYLEEIYKACQQLVRLTDLLLNISRLELGTLKIEPELVDIGKVIDNVLSELLLQIRNKKIKVNKDYGKTPLIVNADPNIIHIIFQNLLSNAVKYVHEESNVGISIKRQNSSFLVKISDNGYGIPKNQRSRIFTKFFRAENIREKEPDGTGLGLYIVKSFIQESGGKIWFKSEENKGTTFYIKIPSNIKK